MLTSNVLRILLVDDDPLVHQATLFALDDSLIAGKHLHFIHASSALQARSLMQSPDTPPIDVCLIDLLMETPTAGAQLCLWIKKELGSTAGLILRSGQTGLSPDQEQILMDQGVHILDKGAQTIDLLKNTIAQSILNS